MPELTRRRDPEAQQETWLIHYGDVRVGVIAERVGNPDSTPGWQWSCGFYPGSNLAERTSGLAESFDQARRALRGRVACLSRKAHRGRLPGISPRPCAPRLEAGHVGGRTQAADAGCRRAGCVLLWRCDRP